MTNSKSTKRALVSSILAILVCVAMLIGTTFAWFTDTASTSVNTIQAGKLDVELQVATQYEVFTKEDGSLGLRNFDGWEDASNYRLNFVKPQGHEDEAILWEPGCTYVLPPLRVLNKGDLALKFKVVITGIDGDAKLNEAIEWTLPTTYANTDLYATLQPGAEARFKISGHMKEDAGNEYQGLSIDGISITVYATQVASEYDSNGNQYDKDAAFEISDANGLLELAQNVNNGVSYKGMTVTLKNDIVLDGVQWTPIGTKDDPFSGTFDGGNHTISNLSGENGLFGYITDGTVKNLNLADAEIENTNGKGTGILTNRIRHGAVIENVTASGSVRTTGTATDNAYYTGGLIGAVTGNSSTTVIKNCTNNASVYTDGHQAGGIAGYAQCDTTFSDCVNNGDVHEGAGYGAGGIVGFISGCGNDTKAPTINRCSNTGNITSTATAGADSRAGGIVGSFGVEGGNPSYVLVASINQCTNTGTVSATKSGDMCGAKVNYSGDETSNLTLKLDGAVATFVSNAADLTAAINNGGSVVLTRDVTANDIINIDKSINIYGNGNKITAASGKSRVFNVQGTSNDISIKLYGLKIENNNNIAYDRAISFYDNDGKIRLEIDKCTLKTQHYALNVAKDNSDIEVVVKNSELTGYCAAQTWSENSKLTFENCTLTGVNKWDGTGNDFSTVNIAKDDTTEGAKNAVVTLKNCIIKNETSGTANQRFFGICATNATVTATGCTYYNNGTAVPTSDVSANTGSLYVYIETPDYTFTIN